MSGKKTKTLAQRFWEKVDKRGPDDCWIWKGGRNDRGYGHIFVDYKVRMATHVSWEFANGKDFPKGMCACHSCDTPACVNPNHLWVGTNGDNNRDCVAKGRNHYTKKTHCPQGHPYSGKNLVIRSDGYRECAECRRLRNEAKRLKRTERREALKRPYCGKKLEVEG